MTKVIKLRILFLERFQPLLKNVETILFEYLARGSVIIGILDALEHLTPKNPLTGGERVAMLDYTLKKYPRSINSYYIIPIPNCELRGLFVDHICTLVPKFDKVITFYTEIRELFSKVRFDVETPFISIEHLSKDEWLRLLQNNDQVSSPVQECLQRFDLNQRIRDIFSQTLR